MMTELANSRTLSNYIAGARDTQLPPDVMDAARLCLADWLAVVIGAHDQGAGLATRKVAAVWAAQGKSPVFGGGTTAPFASALVNGAFAHCLDYDDTHLGCLAHLSGPTWAAALAVGTETGSSDQDMLKAFVSGFEAAARIGGHGFGETVNKHGFHSTSVLGRFSAAAAAGALMRLNPDQVSNALGAAATTAGGLVASFGTMSKPFHAGKAAMDGILTAQLAGQGFESNRALLETSGDTLAATFLQDASASVPKLEFNGDWEILKNTFKPYAACLLVHPAVECAQKIFGQVGDVEVQSVVGRVNPMVLRFAAKTDPREPLEGKFSISHCIALALCGHDVSEQDFSAERLRDARIGKVRQSVALETDDAIASTAASVRVRLSDGKEVCADTKFAPGNPENPIGWDGMHRKFMSLVEPVYGKRSEVLFDLAQAAGGGANLQKIAYLLSERRDH